MPVYFPWKLQLSDRVGFGINSDSYLLVITTRWQISDLASFSLLQSLTGIAIGVAPLAFRYSDLAVNLHIYLAAIITLNGRL